MRPLSSPSSLLSTHIGKHCDEVCWSKKMRSKTGQTTCQWKSAFRRTAQRRYLLPAAISAPIAPHTSKQTAPTHVSAVVTSKAAPASEQRVEQVSGQSLGTVSAWVGLHPRPRQPWRHVKAARTPRAVVPLTEAWGPLRDGSDGDLCSSPSERTPEPMRSGGTSSRTSPQGQASGQIRRCS